MEKYYGGYKITDYQDLDDWFSHPQYNKEINLKFNDPYLYLTGILVGSFSILKSGSGYIVIAYDTDGNQISNQMYQSTESFFEQLIPQITLPVNLFGLISSQTMSESQFYDFISNFAIPISEYPDNAIEIYLLKSPRKQVTKSLKSVGIISGNYTKPITYRSISLDIVNHSDLPFFNYLYIPELKRYYYVQESTQIKDFAQLTLVEDVLMSWGDLIRSQTAFVTRNQNAYDEDIVDKEVTYDYDKSINYIDITPLADVYGQSSYSENGMYVLKTVDGRSVQ